MSVLDPYLEECAEIAQLLKEMPWFCKLSGSVAEVATLYTIESFKDMGSPTRVSMSDGNLLNLLREAKACKWRIS